jgi:hypothetical protein
MIEYFIFFIVLFGICTFFYKQSVSEFRINQLEWDKRFQMKDLVGELCPIVIRGLPKAQFWTKDDIITRDFFRQIPLFTDRTLRDWIESYKGGQIICPWSWTHAELLGRTSGLSVWSDRWIHGILHSNLLWKAWLRPRYYCWAGERGLTKSAASWTALFVTDGEIRVSMMPSEFSLSLPHQWKGVFLDRLTLADTPFVNDLKFIDIKLRPGHILWIPAHWMYCFTSEMKDVCPMTCMIEYHSIISNFAKRVGCDRD